MARQRAAPVGAGGVPFLGCAHFGVSSWTVERTDEASRGLFVDIPWRLLKASNDLAYRRWDIAGHPIDQSPAGFASKVSQRVIEGVDVDENRLRFCSDASHAFSKRYTTGCANRDA